MEKILQIIAIDIAHCRYVCELVFGVDIFDSDFRVQVDSVRKPFRRNSAGPGYVSHGWIPAFDDHLDHCFSILKKCKASHQSEETSRLTKLNRRCIIQDRCTNLVVGVFS